MPSPPVPSGSTSPDVSPTRSILDRKNSGVLTTNSFTPELIEEIEDLFSVFDKNGDGSVDREEFGPMMRILGFNLSDYKLNMFFHSIDDSGDDLLECKELIRFLKDICEPSTTEEELAEAFRFFSGAHGHEPVDGQPITTDYPSLAECVGMFDPWP